jgi:hypothetical protein
LRWEEEAMTIKILNGEKIREIMLKQCKGKYQRNLILGNQYWSCSDLRGKARTYVYSYRISQKNLLERIEKELNPLGYSWRFVKMTEEHNRKRLMVYNEEQCHIF